MSRLRRLSELSDRDVAALVIDMVSGLEREGKAGSYIKSCMKAVRPWLSFNMRDVKVKIKVRNTDDTPTL